MAKISAEVGAYGLLTNDEIAEKVARLAEPGNYYGEGQFESGNRRELQLLLQHMEFRAHCLEVLQEVAGRPVAWRYGDDHVDRYSPHRIAVIGNSHEGFRLTSTSSFTKYVYVEDEEASRRANEVHLDYNNDQVEYFHGEFLPVDITQDGVPILEVPIGDLKSPYVWDFQFVRRRYLTVEVPPVSLQSGDPGYKDACRARDQARATAQRTPQFVEDPTAEGPVIENWPDHWSTDPNRSPFLPPGTRVAAVESADAKQPTGRGRGGYGGRGSRRPQR